MVDHLMADFEKDGDGQMTKEEFMDFLAFLYKDIHREETVQAWEDHGPNWELLNQ